MLLRGSELQLRHQIAGPSLGSVDPGLQPRARSAPEETLRSPPNPVARQVPVARPIRSPGCIRMTSEYQTVRPHAVQKCVPRWANVPHWQQNLPPAGTATSLTGLYGSAVQAHTSAITQPLQKAQRVGYPKLAQGVKGVPPAVGVGRKEESKSPHVRPTCGGTRRP
jgi:hypothetical protein